MDQEAAMHPWPDKPVVSWRRLLLPTEHGSWALVFEPVAIGLFVAPSVAGVCLSIAVAAGFLSRKPAQIGWADRPGDPNARAVARRWAVLLWMVFAIAFIAAVLLAGTPNILVPWVVAVPFILFYIWMDRLGRSRHLVAELATTAACSVPLVAMALAEGWDQYAACALGLANLARSWPTLLAVRTCLRRSRGEPVSPMPALIAQFAAPALLALLAQYHALPWAAVAINSGLSLRALVLLALPARRFSARQLGISETVVGILYVVSLALAYARR